MGKIIVSTYTTIDGVMESPDWTEAYWNDEISKYKFHELFLSDCLLMGRNTYEGLAKVVPVVADKGGFVDRMNSLPKYVVSNTLEAAEWNNTNIIKENTINYISNLKKKFEKNILVYGSATLVQTLVKHNLIDEYHILVYPLVLGSGKRLFDEDCNIKLNLAKVKSFSSGVVSLIYH